MSSTKNRKLSVSTLLGVLFIATFIGGCSSGGGDQPSSAMEVADPAAPPNTPDISPQAQFLLDNAANSEVTVTDSGLQYNFLRTADGAMPAGNSVVTLDYEGTLIDGTVFDSSYIRGEPSTFSLANTISGFQEGVQLMNVGSQIRLVIPADLAYGDQGVGTAIGPDATLIFEIELLEINSG